MKKLLCLLALIPTLSFAQAVQRGVKPAIRAPKRALNTGPTGSTLLARYPLNSNGVFIPEDAGTVAHVVFDQARTNLATRSQTLESWAALNGGTGAAPVVQTNAAQAPDGTSTAEIVTFSRGAGNTTGDYSILDSNVTTSLTGAYTSSIWLRSTDGVSHKVGLGAYSAATSTVTVTTSWQRFYVTVTLSNGSANVRVMLRGTYGTDTSAQLALWGGQVEQGSTPTDYIPTVASAVTDSLRDTKGNTWTQNGTVPQLAAPGPFVPGRNGAGGANAFSPSNYYSLGSGSDALDFAGDFSVCAVYGGNTVFGGNELLIADGAYQVAGWGLYVAGAGGGAVVSETDTAGTSTTVSTVNNSASNGLNVACFGRAGTTQMVKLNLGTLATGTAKNTPATSTPVYIGRDPSYGTPASGLTIYEVWASTTTPTDALFTAIQRAVLGHLGSKGEAITVTRSTTATYTGADGRVYTAAPGVLRITENPRTNLLTASGTVATGSGWTYRAGLAATANAGVDPVGGNAAEQIAWTSGDGYIWQTLKFAASTSYTISVWARATAASPTIRLNAYDGASTFAGSVQALTGEWVRYTSTFTTGAGAGLGDVGFKVISGTALLWGAQLETGSTATAYIPTTTAAVAVWDQPGALIEGAATNVATYSQSGQGHWSAGTGVTLTNNSAVAPDGTTTATTVAYNGSGSAGTWRMIGSGGVVSANGSPYTASMWLRADAPVTVRIGTNVGTSATANVTTSWQRFTATNNGDGSTYAQPTISSPVGVATAFTVYAWGAQAEAGSVATSYIPTTSASVTRSADVVSVATPAGMPLNRWCIGATATPLAWVSAANQSIWSTGAATASSATLYITTAANPKLRVMDGSAGQRLLDYGTGLSGARRLFGCEGAGALGVYSDGVSGGSPSGAGTGQTASNLTPVYLGSDPGGSQQFAGTLSDLRICKSSKLGGDCR